MLSRLDTIPERDRRTDGQNCSKKFTVSIYNIDNIDTKDRRRHSGNAVIR